MQTFRIHAIIDIVDFDAASAQASFYEALEDCEYFGVEKAFITQCDELTEEKE